MSNKQTPSADDLIMDYRDTLIDWGKPCTAKEVETFTRLKRRLEEIDARDAEIKALREALESLRQPHHICEDCWYSCPKSSEGCCNKSDEGCTCGADIINAKIDAALGKGEG